MYYQAAQIEDIKPGEAFLTEVGGVEIVICNVSGEYYAIEDVCSHDGSSFDTACVESRRITCPRHGADFDVTTGEALTPPAFSPVQTYPVRVQNGVVEVDIEAY